jgi:hypothetical protein
MVAGESAAVPLLAYGRIACHATALCAALGALALFVSVLARDRGAAALAYGAVIFVAMALDVASRLWMRGEWIGRFSPYGWFRPARVLSTPDVTASFTHAGVLVLAAAVFMTAAAMAESRRRSV